MRGILIAASAACLFIMTSPGFAADLSVRPHKQAAAPQPSRVAEASCLRWVEQNYSWYNYCDPIPDYGRELHNWPF
jgi:hypothetical protein